MQDFFDFIAMPLCREKNAFENDIALDPFFGTETAGRMADRLNRKWIGIERNERYIIVAKERLKLKLRKIA
jgi:DNA modification methylase